MFKNEKKLFVTVMKCNASFSCLEIVEEYVTIEKRNGRGIDT